MLGREKGEGRRESERKGGKRDESQIKEAWKEGTKNFVSPSLTLFLDIDR